MEMHTISAIDQNYFMRKSISVKFIEVQWHIAVIIVIPDIIGQSHSKI